MANRNNVRPVVRNQPESIDDGSQARGETNSRSNQTATQPEPDAILIAAGANDPTALTPSREPSKGNAFELHSERLQERISAKVQLMGTVRQQIAEAAELYGEGSGKAKEAAQVADKAAIKLYQARVAGMVSNEEVSAVLGDNFGYKLKKDQTPGKTPDGEGEAIRKRIVRLVQAKEHLTNGDGGKLFEGLTADSANETGDYTLGGVVASVEAGNLSIWTAYDYIGKIAAAAKIKSNPAFDHKKVAAIVESLCEEGAYKIIGSNPSLMAAYTGLADIIAIVGGAIEADKRLKAKVAAMPLAA